jgi:hypothetical protein
LLDNTAKLAEITEQDPKHQDEKHLSTIDMAGLSLFARCIQSALEHGYEQSGNETAQKAKADPF